MAREIVKLGMYIGMGGVVTFKNARVTPTANASMLVATANGNILLKENLLMIKN